MKKKINLTTQGQYVKDLFGIQETDSIEVLSADSSFYYDLFADGEQVLYEDPRPVKLFSFSKLSKNVSDVVEVEYNKISGLRRDLVLFDGTISSNAPVRIDLTKYDLSYNKFYIYITYEGQEADLIISSGKFINGNFDYADVKFIKIGNTGEGIQKRFVVGFFNFDDVMKITTTASIPFGIKVIVCKEE
ncbi:MAG: hypothetical protein QXF61_09215 [Nitrososphaeria archaeon]